MPKAQRAIVTTTPMPKRTSSVDPLETPHAKFIRLANHRSRKVIKALRELSRLGSSVYEKSEDEVAKIEDVLRSEMSEAFRLLRAVRPDPLKVGDILS